MEKYLNTINPNLLAFNHTIKEKPVLLHITVDNNIV
jgi:hypothetical protein